MGFRFTIFTDCAFLYHCFFSCRTSYVCWIFNNLNDYQRDTFVTIFFKCLFPVYGWLMNRLYYKTLVVDRKIAAHLFFLRVILGTFSSFLFLLWTCNWPFLRTYLQLVTGVSLTLHLVVLILFSWFSCAFSKAHF